MRKEVSFKVNNKIYKGFEKMTISKSIDNISHTFTAEMYNGKNLAINGNDSIEILLDGEIFFSGYIEDYDLKISDTKSPLSIAGRSRTCDLVDCMIETNKLYNQQDAKQIIEDMVKPFGITVSTELALEPILQFKTKVAETFFNAINRLCKENNILPICKSDGNIILSKNNNEQHSKVLKEGDLKSIDFKQKFTSRYSSYTYKKEGSYFDVTDGKIEDAEIKRYRPFVEVNTDDKQNLDMCKFQMNKHKADSMSLSIALANWDIDINKIVKIETEDINNSFLVKSASYHIGDGLYSELELIDKDLYNV